MTEVQRKVAGIKKTTISDDVLRKTKKHIKPPTLSKGLLSLLDTNYLFWKNQINIFNTRI